MAATSPNTTWPLADERASIAPSPAGAATRWRARFADPCNRLYRYRLARLLVRGLAKTRVTPSQVTIVQPVLAAIAGYLLTFGDARHLLIAAALFEARAILGCVDVTLARAKGLMAAEGRAERAAARGISAAFLYATVAWHVHLHALPTGPLGAYLPASALALASMVAAIALGGWLFARSPRLAVA